MKSAEGAREAGKEKGGKRRRTEWMMVERCVQREREGEEGKKGGEPKIRYDAAANEWMVLSRIEDELRPKHDPR